MVFSTPLLLTECIHILNDGALFNITVKKLRTNKRNLYLSDASEKYKFSSTIVLIEVFRKFKFNNSESTISHIKYQNMLSKNHIQNTNLQKRNKKNKQRWVLIKPFASSGS